MRPALKTRPVDSVADPKTAEVMNGMIRAIEQSCNAEIAYDWAAESAITSGKGYFRITSDYTDPESFEQDIVTSRCPDVMMPKDVHRTDQAIKAMPWYMRIAILCTYYPERAEVDAKLEIRHIGKWTPGDQLRLFKVITGKPKNNYYDLCREGQSWIAGGIR